MCFINLPLFLSHYFLLSIVQSFVWVLYFLISRLQHQLFLGLMLLNVVLKSWILLKKYKFCHCCGIKVWILKYSVQNLLVNDDNIGFSMKRSIIHRSQTPTNRYIYTQLIRGLHETDYCRIWYECCTSTQHNFGPGYMWDHPMFIMLNLDSISCWEDTEHFFHWGVKIPQVTMQWSSLIIFDIKNIIFIRHKKYNI